MVVVWKTVEIRFWQPVTDNVVEHPLQAQVARAQHLLVDLGVPVLDEAEGEVHIVLVVYAEAVALLWQSLALLEEVEVLPQRVVVNHLFQKQEIKAVSSNRLCSGLTIPYKLFLNKKKQNYW